MLPGRVPFAVIVVMVRLTPILIPKLHQLGLLSVRKPKMLDFFTAYFWLLVDGIAAIALILYVLRVQKKRRETPYTGPLRRSTDDHEGHTT